MGMHPPGVIFGFRGMREFILMLLPEGETAHPPRAFGFDAATGRPGGALCPGDFR